MPQRRTTPARQVSSGQPDWDYVYDALDLLIEVRRDDVTVERYRYDALGRRSLIETVDSGGAATRIAIVNDGPDRSLDLRADDEGLAAIYRRYTHSDNVDEPLLMEAFNDNGAPEGAYSYHADYIGSIRYMTDEAGQVVNAYEYDSYGRPLYRLETVAQPFAYTGREYDAATNLYHYRARSYDASTGRFMQEDPIGYGGGDFNFFRYVGSNPVNYSDPSGLSAIAENATTRSVSLKSAAGMAGIACGTSAIFTGLASALDPLSEGSITGFSMQQPCIISANYNNNPKLLPPIITPYPDVSPAGLPPGNCGPDQYQRLKKAKDILCATKRSCKAFGLSRENLLGRAANGMACEAAQEKLMNLCFAGGDSGHRRALEKTRKVTQVCREKI